ncbi:MAG: tRNA 4-thiouridine(8) synthase ThiI, partial [Candidatus Falkowbacteria bacterium]|nr:tRNA 4-thiouridine(8) synthase ThiI [Candidatus Falkowbacteria bacterium]
YSEISLKGGNRDFFEKKLINNIKNALKKNCRISFSVKKIFGRLIAVPVGDPNEIDYEEATKALLKVFGIANFAFAKVVTINMEIFKNECLMMLEKKRFKTFRISTRRSDKNFSLNSQEINTVIGAYIVEKTGAKVSLKEAEVDCHIEIVNKEAYIYLDKIKGLGGMPVGSANKALVLISGGFDSPVASWYALKRGVNVDYLHFHSMPYTDRASLDKVNDLVEVLKQYGGGDRIYLSPFAEIQKQIMVSCPEKLRVVLYRRMMMRIAEKIAIKKRYYAIVTGENISQVASQTLENLRAIEAVIQLPIIRPLICFDKEEIINQARLIGTHDISTKPHDDCCTRFIPKNPETKARLNEVEKAEENLDVIGLVNEAVEEILK